MEGSGAMTGDDARDWNDLPAWIKVYMSEKAFLDEDGPGRGPSGMGPDDPGGADFGGSWQLFDESVPRPTPKSATWRISWLVADADQSHEVYATNRNEVLLFGTHPCSRCVPAVGSMSRVHITPVGEEQSWR